MPPILRNYKKNWVGQTWNEEKIRELAACRLLAEQAYIDRNIILNVKVQIARLRGLGMEVRSEPEYYETFILLAARAKVPGAAANSHMSVLRRKRETAGELAKYYDFEKMIADYSGGVRFSGHGYYDRGLEDADTNAVFGGTNANLLKVLEGLGHKAFRQLWHAFRVGARQKTDPL